MKLFAFKFLLLSLGLISYITRPLHKWIEKGMVYAFVKTLESYRFKAEQEAQDKESN